jgi:hypothetical protein
MKFLLVFIIFASHLKALANDASNQVARLKAIAAQTNDPGTYLKELGPLVVMGNASLSDAQVVLLPEVHDDPGSQLVQLLLIAKEKQKNKPFIILDESLESLEQSSWEFFSQKTMEILAAEQSQSQKTNYSPRGFEQSLQNLATKFRESTGQLSYINSSGYWVLAPYSSKAMPFFGWDMTRRESLVERNVYMVEKSLKRAMAKHNRIFVMLGARHVPELEFYTSEQLICPDQRHKNIEEFFNQIQKKYGAKPDLTFGIGSTAPIYRFLKDKKYALVFSKRFYETLKDVVNDFTNKSGGKSCVDL